MAIVRLYGDLTDFGTRFDLKVKTAGEAMRALFTQIDGLQRRISEGGYFVRVARKDVTDNTIGTDFSRDLTDNDVIHVVPEIAGAGKFGQIILGTAMIGAAFFTGGASIAAWGALSTGLLTAGIGMVLGGVAQMLTKQPSFGDTSNTNKSRSSSFSSLGNNTAQGSCVPVAYGEIMIGSKVISQSIESYKVSGDVVAKDAAQLVQTRDYHVPTAFDNYNLDADDDSVRAVNYIVRVD
ncbi:tail assembly protein [Psychrobacter sp. FDAARGOS_221]|uniref:tail assembly protein n=1 Tax=Psychrobacter sp. FDAARGOS_221 TaxID=1975705 RepID=UPI000BB58DF9|nr:tail assembly protein [Psychrobacter sp. FDAARGOS_221]PNK59476.1 tail assembly protein [Psychrobacter sp. FDAARGOS_221]PNK59910.1 tail assembly protein [Psychrobacter sp. FDAARGOS_221]PNK61456.1 tail assembly protein [Psychrobacter sp. FDAARGOS_221]